MEKWGSFKDRHIGPKAEDVNKMLGSIGVKSLDQLIDQTVPSKIRNNKDLNIPEGQTEHDYLNNLKKTGQKNKLFTSFIGLGYYNNHIPNVIKRNVLENPGWYTAYTPYQAEIAQGRMEALLNFQTITVELTGLPIANASLLDEGTAGAEALVMFFNSRSRASIKAGANKFFISENCFPQTIDVVKTKAINLGVDLIIDNPDTFVPDESVFGAIVQYPDGNGEIKNFKDIADKIHAVGGKIAAATDLLSLVLLTPPAAWGADVAFGNSQRFGVPLGYGGPHAAFFAATESFKRNMPGRIIGISKDSQGLPALRMALQTREQHIRREKATSNICTAQALLAVMASMYAVYHGPDGLKHIATSVHKKAVVLTDGLKKLGFKNLNNSYFDTLKIELKNKEQQLKLKDIAEASGINLRYYETPHVGISVDEAINIDDLNKVLEVFAKLGGGYSQKLTEKEFDKVSIKISGDAQRSDAILTHPVFNLYHSETEMMRYLKRLENKDLSLTHSMIPLGSCTMKLNAAAELYPITWPEYANIHPFVPIDQAKGYGEIIEELNKDLSEITGFDEISFQPNSGAQGEYTGLLVIKAFHEANGDKDRNIVLIPSSAHGTNPASAVMAGLDVVVTKCDSNGNIDLVDLKEKAEKHKDNLCALMITYPSTHGVFEEQVIDITTIIHENGGQVYMDGANMNAQVGLTSPGKIGADVCHLNLHKTFAIPHGGGGPGMGPIGVKSHLAPFLPGNPLVKTGGNKSITAVASAPFGSALILLISFGYVKMLGREGLKKSTEVAILNANYLKTQLEKHFDILYQGKNGRVAHEMIVECRGFKKEAGVEVEDIAKRLMDYGFHAPTVSFPVAGTLMIEPTESESKEELDRFCDAMIEIKNEIDEIAKNPDLKTNNVLKNAPHTLRDIVSDWDRPYSHQKAIAPLPYIMEGKFWPSVNRVNNAEGDRNLICACIPIEAYEEQKDLTPA